MRCSDVPSSWEFLASQRVARETRDMREGRDVDRLDSHLVSPVPQVSLGYPSKYMVMKRKAFGVVGYSVLLLIVLGALGFGCGLQSQSFAEDATDLYFKTPGTPDGPSAPSPPVSYTHLTLPTSDL